MVEFQASTVVPHGSIDVKTNSPSNLFTSPSNQRGKNVGAMGFLNAVMMDRATQVPFSPDKPQIMARIVQGANETSVT